MKNLDSAAHNGPNLKSAFKLPPLNLYHHYKKKKSTSKRMELHTDFSRNVFGKKKGFWEELTILQRRWKIQLIQYREMFLQFKYLTEINNKQNGTASTEIFLGWKNVDA